MLLVGGTVIGLRVVLAPGAVTGTAPVAGAAGTTFVLGLLLVLSGWGAGAGFPDRAFCKACCSCASRLESVVSAGNGANGPASAAWTNPLNELNNNVSRNVFTIV